MYFARNELYLEDEDDRDIHPFPIYSISLHASFQLCYFGFSGLYPWAMKFAKQGAVQSC